MVTPTPLREVVSANAVAAVAAANQAFAHGRVFGSALGAVFFLDTSGQHFERLCFVAVLAAAVLAFGHDARGQVGDAHGRVGFVDVLATCTAGAVGVDAQIRRIDFDGLSFIWLGQHRHRARAGVDAALGFSSRHALHAVAARLELEPAIHAVATGASVHADHHFFVAAQLAL